MLAATRALGALLEQEQTQRQAVAALFGKLSGTLVQEDRLRRDAQTEAFKALPEADRKAHTARQQAVRGQIKAQQVELAAARATLNTQREAIAKQFPAYADLVTPSTPKPESLRRLLAPGEALLVIHPADTATLVWLVGAEGHNGFSASKLTRDEIARRGRAPCSTSAPRRPGASPPCRRRRCMRSIANCWGRWKPRCATCRALADHRHQRTAC